MGIDERRAREREQRRADILTSAWLVAEDVGWVSFSVERVAEKAELGRATIYSYFESLEALVLEMAKVALAEFSDRVAQAPGLTESLDVPVRFSVDRPAAFALLFPPARDPRPAFSSPEIETLRLQAREVIGRLQSLVDRKGGGLPSDEGSAAAFVAGISMAGAFVPELRTSTPLRRQWQEYCLRIAESGTAGPDEGRKT